MILKCFLQVYGLSFWILNSIATHFKISLFWCSPINSFFLFLFWFWCLIRINKLSPNQCCKNVLLFFKICIILAFIFWSLVYFESIFFMKWRKRPTQFFCIWVSRWPRTICCEEYWYSKWMASAWLSKISWTLIDCFVSGFFYSIPLIYMPIYVPASQYLGFHGWLRQ